MSALYVHVGFPKSASSTIQNAIFMKHNHIHYLGLHPYVEYHDNNAECDCNYHSNPDLYRLHTDLLFKDSIDYEYHQLSDMHRKILGENLSTQKINVLSNERFVSVFSSHQDRLEKARRLHMLEPSAKIIFVVRNQLNIIKSQYYDAPYDPRCLESGKPVSIEDWIGIDINKPGASFLSSIKYNEIVSIYIDLFGNKNVKVLFFEDLISNVEKFSSELAQFMSLPDDEINSLLSDQHSNPRVSERYAKIRSIKRRYFDFIDTARFKDTALFRKLMTKLRSGKPVSTEISPELMHVLDSYYAESNMKFFEMLKIEPGAYNYPGLMI